MKLPILIGAAALAASAVAPGTADAQPWRYRWHPWHERFVYRVGWAGPVWYGRPGPYYGWYRWNARYYRHCGYAWGPRGFRTWRCW